jgi:putative tryptophan/tyrosine transport system substrate-binding protein
VNRREVITLLGGAATLPPRANAQQSEHARRIGMLTGIDDTAVKVFIDELAKLGWSEGHNIQIISRYAPAGTQVQMLAKELVDLRPDVIFAQTRPVTAALRDVTSTIPIVFNLVVDPIGAGFVQSFPRPGGNITGFVVYEAAVVGKWMAMLKEIAPQTARVALLGNPDTAAYYEYFLHAAETAAPSLAIGIVPTHIANNAADIERSIENVASIPNTGMVVIPEPTTSINRELIVLLAARYRLPTMYPGRFFVVAGGLMSYAFISEDQYRQAAQYVDQILRGAKPSDLPVQVPAKFETVLNLKTAKELGLAVPAGLLVAADEVIE